MTQPLLLDLFCGAGGAGEGYVRAGFRVVGCDLDPKPLRHNPHECHVGDALTVLDTLLAGERWQGYQLRDFAAIHASPPCQGYSRMRHLTWLKGRVYPRLIPQVRARLVAAGAPYVIENVADAPLDPSLILCGLSFGLRLYRHRRFESNLLLLAPPHLRHRETIGAGRMLGSRYSRASAGVTGMLPDLAGHTAGASTRAAAIAMGVEWMPRDYMTQAIPPAYTEWLGRQLLGSIRTEASA